MQQYLYFHLTTRVDSKFLRTQQNENYSFIIIAKNNVS